MSCGSFFTIYRKNKTNIVSKEIIDALKNEYYLLNKNHSFLKTNDKNDDKLKNDIPILMNANLKHNSVEDSNDYIFYDCDGVTYTKLLDFHFISTFSCLKKEWNLNPYYFKSSSKLVSKNEAEKILQAIKYVLSEKYSKEFEDILSNEYVEIFGEDYSPFINRFINHKHPIHIDKDGPGHYVIEFDDNSYNVEIAECDACAKSNMERVKICIEAFLQTEIYSWNNEDLVLEYSVYG